MADVQAKVVENEVPSRAEAEETVLENAGVNTKQEDGTYKVDLRSNNQTQQEDAVQEQSADEVPVRDEPEAGQEVVEEIRDAEEPTEESEEQVLQEITEDDEQSVQLQTPEQTASGTSETESQQVSDQNQEVKIDLPEGVEKLVEFMNETGGTLEDYVRLNADYNNIDENSLLREYYKQKKAHLSNEEINFLIEDKFSFDEEIDDERDIKRKKLAFKEEVAEARNFLESLKGQYYQEVKLGSRLNPEQQKAVDFFNRYNEEQSSTQQLLERQASKFQQETDKVFSQDFKGFDFKVGDKRYRFNVKDIEATKSAQSDIMNAFSNFVDTDNTLKDGHGYHKALFTARNADAIANHFYEQGKADAIKTLEAQSKNINMDPRKSGVIEAGGAKVRVVSGENSSKLKIKLKK
jgi:hypothetical protein